ncbi:Membrane associated serine protease, rhomboid family [Salinihabitans flavidus]|uniref:Membrane associated serine protease, rhomboid family n=1 Tax=Salinihabitans flavidus TaxID=569882 RepID=A0A1H8LDD8_9RHOB|nr:rhomboid family intramembrane serine protease [Salinihabitans flavidus]SEO03083.1 Membrane associated serine protease, rhomboid family [Salinihabitans flavidus]
MSDPETNHSPINPIPPVVVALFLVVIGIELAFVLGARGLVGGPQAVGWRLGAIQTYAFSDDIFIWMATNGIWPLEHLMRFVSYLFVHANFTHALFGSAMVLALGKFVGEVFSGWKVLVIFVLSGAAGAFGFTLFLTTSAPLLGVFPGVYGLIGAFTFLMWLKLGQMGANQYRAFLMIGLLLGIQLLFGLIFGGNGDWVADLVGFVTGFLLSFVLVPGGWARIRARLRHD